MRWQEKSVSFEELASVPAPNTFINRQRDRIVAVGQALAAALPRAQFKVLPGCGHLPALEKPEESAAMFSKLLKTAEARAI